MLEALRTCFRPLPPKLKSRWSLLAFLLGITSFAELAAAVVLFRFLGGNVPSLDAGTSGGFETGGGSFIALVGIFFGKSALGITATALRATVIAESTQSIFSRLVRRDLTARVDQPASSAQQIWRAMHVSDIAYRIVASAGVSLFAEGLAAAALVAGMIYVAPSAALGATVTIGLVCAALLAATRGITSRTGAESHRRTGEIAAAMHSIFGVTREIRSKRREEAFAEVLSDVHARRLTPLRRHLFLLSFPRHVIELTFIAVLVAVILFTNEIGSREQFIALLGVFAYAGFRLVPAANRILFAVDEIRHQQEAVRELDLAFAQPIVTPVETERKLRNMVLNEVSHRYPGSDRDALSGISLTISPGERIGLLGHSGSGKSTLILLIGGLIEPTSGQIEIGDERATDWLRSGGKVGLVPQGALLLDGSVRENIAFGGSLGEDDLGRALRIAELEQTVASLRNGLDTRVGERGWDVSGGERQRIAIARAIAETPDLILLDEATSALDQPTEKTILENLDGEFNGTIVIAAHRPRSLVICDRLIVLSEGRIVAQGSAAELMETSSEFRRLMSEDEPASQQSG